MNREIKFRAWNKKKQRMTVYTMYDNYELMQYTGLHDKNGREIYEGDVVKSFVYSVSNGTIDVEGIVRFESGRFEVADNHNLNFAVGDFKKDNALEVIGNIYENPELVNK